MHFGTPSEHQKRCFTAVLKGHIALDSCVAGTTCCPRCATAVSTMTFDCNDPSEGSPHRTLAPASEGLTWCSACRITPGPLLPA